MALSCLTVVLLCCAGCLLLSHLLLCTSPRHHEREAVLSVGPGIGDCTPVALCLTFRVHWAHFSLVTFLGCSCHLAVKTLFSEVCGPLMEPFPLSLSALTHLTDEAEVGRVPQATHGPCTSSSSSLNCCCLLLTQDSIWGGNE